MVGFCHGGNMPASHDGNDNGYDDGDDDGHYNEDIEDNDGRMWFDILLDWWEPDDEDDGGDCAQHTPAQELHLEWQIWK